jgi:hypothetical protein
VLGWEPSISLEQGSRTYPWIEEQVRECARPARRSRLGDPQKKGLEDFGVFEAVETVADLEMLQGLSPAGRR